jgi:hypothetical protein
VIGRVTNHSEVVLGKKSDSGKLEIQSGVADFRWMVRLTAGKGMLL